MTTLLTKSGSYFAHVPKELSACCCDLSTVDHMLKSGGEQRR